MLLTFELLSIILSPGSRLHALCARTKKTPQNNPLLHRVIVCHPFSVPRSISFVFLCLMYSFLSFILFVFRLKLCHYVTVFYYYYYYEVYNMRIDSIKVIQTQKSHIL